MRAECPSCGQSAGVFCIECGICSLCHRLYTDPERSDLEELVAILLQYVSKLRA